MQIYCPALFEFPAQPIAWNNVHLIYSLNRTYPDEIQPDYICFHEQSCNTWPMTIRFVKISEPTTILSCQKINKLSFMLYPTIWETFLRSVRLVFRRQCALTANNVEKDCPGTTQFRCGKKCLSKHRLMDNVQDCTDDSDEKYNNSCALNDKHRIYCTHSRYEVYANRCVSRVFALNTYGKWLCIEQKKLPHFPTLCDSYVEYTDTTNGQIETDEINCEEWLCDNQYTRCDGIWNCLNGADEIHCPGHFCKNNNAHPCAVMNSSKPICLPISRAGDGIVDCMGATDERHLCRDKDSIQETQYRCRDKHANEEQVMNK